MSGKCVAAHQSTIAAAVGEQNATTTSMTRTLTEAAAGADHITGRLALVAASTRDVNTAASDVADSATRLTTATSTLQTALATYHY